MTGDPWPSPAGRAAFWLLLWVATPAVVVAVNAVMLPFRLPGLAFAYGWMAVDKVRGR